MRYAGSCILLALLGWRILSISVPLVISGTGKSYRIHDDIGAAINACIANLPRDTGGTCMVPGGTWAIYTPIFIDADVEYWKEKLKGGNTHGGVDFK